MIKNEVKGNKLIIRKNLAKEIKKRNVLKITPESIDLIIKESEIFIQKIISKAKENMDISARKTLKKEDIIEAVKEKEEEYDL